jgi:hypothetical protein
MSEAPKQKIEEGTPWGRFFFIEFENLKINTGILQWEKLKETDRGRDEARQLIGEMTLECKKPPFDRIRKDVIQRVIHAAVIEDTDFIGFSVKFIRKTLNKWWSIYGDKILQELQKIADEEAEKNKPAPFVNPHVDVDAMVENYRRRLVQPVPKMEKAEYTKKGEEWKSNIERKAVKYSNGMTLEEFKLKEKIQRTASEFYRKLSSFSGLKMYQVNSFDVFAASQEDAEQIYLLATKKD